MIVQPSGIVTVMKKKKKESVPVLARRDKPGGGIDRALAPRVTPRSVFDVVKRDVPRGNLRVAYSDHPSFELDGSNAAL